MNNLSKLLFLGCFFVGSVHAAQGDFTIASIGSSNNTDTIFIETLEAANSASICSSKKVFRLPDSDKAADRLFSLALAAQAQGKKITIDYSNSECLGGSVLIQAFRLKK